MEPAMSRASKCNAADDEADNGADEQWLTPNAKALPWTRRQCRCRERQDLIDQPVQTHRRLVA